MSKWIAILVVLLLAMACCRAMGVGPKMMAELLAALLAMTAVAFLIARPFLAKAAARSREQSDGSD